MPQQTLTTIENNFVAGLKTEYTGLNFPENACTDTDNCVFSLNGEVSRRPGFEYEPSVSFNNSNNTIDKAISSFVWTSPGGTGEYKILVEQVGENLIFYRFSDGGPVSTTKLSTSISVYSFSIQALGTSNNECQYAEGNGFLFVFHPACDPFYCTYNPTTGIIDANRIEIKIRDVKGIIEGWPDNYRPVAYSAAHQYNLFNQGWTSNPTWSAVSSTSTTVGTGVKNYTIATGLTITAGTQTVVDAYDSSFGGSAGRHVGATMTGTVTSYNSGTGAIVLNLVTAVYGTFGPGSVCTDWTLRPVNAGIVNTWLASQGNYPSNSDVWWRFKNTSEVFDPTTTAPNVTLGSGPSPKGFYVMNAFNQDKTGASGLAGLPDPIFTGYRPSTGAWYQGRVWYSGVHGNFPNTGNVPAYSWSENIYFSQIAVDTNQFGRAYQNNDPTSEQFFDLLPSDGGLITIQGAGNIYKLFPIQNGMLVFASNGIWVIAGSQGIGFAANDYSITKISSVPTLSGSSFVNVQGWPMFWNEDGIWAVTPADNSDDRQKGGFSVNNLVTRNIDTFYQNIPSVSKRYAKGDYDPLSYEIKWIFRRDVEENLTSRYEYQRVLNFNTITKAFYPYSIGSSAIKIKDIKYLTRPATINSPEPTFKYFCALNNAQTTFVEERDTTHWKDFWGNDSVGVNYDSYFITGYKLHGKAVAKFQPTYILLYNKNEVDTSYKIQGIWDYANSGNSGRYSSLQVVNSSANNFDNIVRRVKIRGRGLALQLKVVSVDGTPFNIIGWTSMETVNAGI